MPPKRWTTGCLAKINNEAEYSDVMETVPKTVQPKTLAEFGYCYNSAGKLVQKKNDKPFAWLGQKHYDGLGEAIVQEIYTIMKERYGFKEERIQGEEADGGDGATTTNAPGPGVPIFLSANFDTAKEVVFLCQGSGAVRPGMWARALCINDSLKDGTIFDYLEECAKENWAVVVLNPNENGVLPPEPEQWLPSSLEAQAAMTPEQVREYWLGTPDPEWKKFTKWQWQEQVPVPGSFRPEVHAELVWDKFIVPNPRPTMIVAHSYGGKCTTNLLRNRFPLVSSIVVGIALTDAINDLGRGKQQEVKDQVRFMVQHSVNWVGSKRPLDAPEREGPYGCTEVSSGHNQHEWTSASCRTSVFPFLKKKLSAFMERQKAD